MLERRLWSLKKCFFAKSGRSDPLPPMLRFLDSICPFRWFGPLIGLVFIGLLGSAGVAAESGDDLPPLNDPPTRDQLGGKFVWADLFTSDPAAAAKFYQDLFEWSSKEVPRAGRTLFILSQGGRPVAGVVQRPVPGGASPHARWISYLGVGDVEIALARVSAAGGRMLAPRRDVPQRGSQAIVADSEGAVVGLLHSSTGDPADYRAEPGEWMWAQLFAGHPELAAAFYRRVFAFEVAADGTAETHDRFVLSASGFARAGIAPLPTKENAEPTWLGFVRVASAGETVRRAVALGGREIMPPRSSRAGGHFAIVADPTGGVIGVSELDESVAVPAP